MNVRTAGALVAVLICASAVAEVRPLRIAGAPFELTVAEWTPPSRRFPITDFGAVPEGPPVTEAIERAVAKAHAAGGGRVFIPDGRWICGAFRLKGNVALELADGAVLHFPDDPEVVMRQAPKADGRPVLTRRALVGAEGCTNVAVIGKGAFEVETAYWHDNFLEGYFAGAKKLFPRPQFLQFRTCGNVRLEGFTVRGSPGWTLHLLMCDDVVLRDVTSVCSGPNSDGLDLDSCNRVLVERCSLDQGDDCFTIKSGLNEEGRRRNRPSQNIVIRNCRAVNGHSLLGIGSEVSGGIRNVFMSDCEIVNECWRFLYVKTSPVRGGFVENVELRNCRGRRATSVFDLEMMYDGNPVKELNRALERRFVTKIGNVRVRNVVCGEAKRGVRVIGDGELPPADIRVENVRIGRVTGKLTETRAAENVAIRDVREDPSAAAFPEPARYRFEWGPAWAQGIPCEVEVPRAEIADRSCGSPNAELRLFAEKSDGTTVPLKAKYLRGRDREHVRVRFDAPPVGTKSVFGLADTIGWPSDPGKTDNLFGNACSDPSRWTTTPRVKATPCEFGGVLLSAIDAGAPYATCEAAVPKGLGGKPVVLEMIVENAGAESFANPIVIEQLDAAGDVLPEQVVDRRWIGHVRPVGAKTRYLEGGRLHPKAAKVRARVTLDAAWQPYDREGRPQPHDVARLPKLLLKMLALRPCAEIPFPKYDDSFFPRGVSGRADDASLRLGGDDETAFWFQTRSSAAWADKVQVRREGDLFFPMGAGTVEAWFRPEGRRSAVPQSLFEGYQCFHAEAVKAGLGTVLSLSWSSASNRVDLLARDADGHAFRGTASADIPVGKWTHVAVQWDPAGCADVMIGGRRVLSVPLKGYVVPDVGDGKVAFPNEIGATEFYLGSAARAARLSADALPDSPFFDGAADSLRISAGCRYAVPFVPERDLKADADTRAFFSFDRTFDGVSSAGVGYVPGTLRSRRGRTACGRPLSAEDNPSDVLRRDNYEELPTDEDFWTMRRRMVRRAGLAVGGRFSFTAPPGAVAECLEIRNGSSEELVAPVLLNAGEADARSFGDLGASLALNGLGERERANRVFQFALSSSDYFMNHTAYFRPGSDVPEFVGYGDKPLILLNGYCGFECGPLNHMIANAFVESAGLPASQLAGYQHQFQQVFYGGRNRLYDLSAQTFFPAMDNTGAASLGEIEDEPYSLVRGGMPPRYYVRAGTRGFWVFRPAAIPKVGVTLAPGETFRAWRVNDGNCNDLVTFDREGPYRGYPSKTRPDYSVQTHADVTKRLLQRVERYFPDYINGFIVFNGKPTTDNPAFVSLGGDSFAYRVRSGYPIVRGEYAAKRRDGSLAGLEISTDRGKTWRTLVSPADYAVMARSEYLVRVCAPIGEIETFSARTEVQMNPRVFPGRVRPGANEFILKAEKGTSAEVSVGWTVPDKRMRIDGPIARSGAIRGHEKLLAAFDSSKELGFSVGGLSGRAKAICHGNVSAVVKSGRLTLRAADPRRTGFGWVVIDDDGACKTLTVLSGPGVRMAVGAVGGRFCFDPLPTGRYAVLNLNRFRSHAPKNAPAGLRMSWKGRKGEPLDCGWPRNDACDFKKASFGRAGEWSRWKWDFPHQHGTAYPYLSMRVGEFPALDCVTVSSVAGAEAEVQAVLVVPDPDADLRRDLIKNLCGLNCEPATVLSEMPESVK